MISLSLTKALNTENSCSTCTAVHGASDNRPLSSGSETPALFPRAIPQLSSVLHFSVSGPEIV